MEHPLATSNGATVGSDSDAGRPVHNELTAGAAARPMTTSMAIEDQQALAQLRRGNWASMEQLVQRYQDRLYAAVFRIVGHPEDAADLVQETFVKAMQNVSRFEGKSALYTWLFRIAVNLAISHRRAGVYRMALSLDGDPSRHEEHAVNQQAAALRRQLAQHTESDPAAAAEMRLEHERLVAALQKLDPDFRAVIVLRDIEDCDYEQIAEIMEVPVGTIKSRLFRARSALREALTVAE